MTTHRQANSLLSRLSLLWGEEGEHRSQIFGKWMKRNLFYPFFSQLFYRIQYDSTPRKWMDEKNQWLKKEWLAKKDDKPSEMYPTPHHCHWFGFVFWRSCEMKLTNADRRLSNGFSFGLCLANEAQIWGWRPGEQICWVLWLMVVLFLGPKLPKARCWRRCTGIWKRFSFDSVQRGPP